MSHLAMRSTLPSLLIQSTCSSCQHAYIPRNPSSSAHFPPRCRIHTSTWIFVCVRSSCPLVYLAFSSSFSSLLFLSLTLSLVPLSLRVFFSFPSQQVISVFTLSFSLWLWLRDERDARKTRYNLFFFSLSLHATRRRETRLEPPVTMTTLYTPTRLSNCLLKPEIKVYCTKSRHFLMFF